MEGQGEILRIEATPANGKREITIDTDSRPDHRRRSSTLCPSPTAWPATATARIKSRITFDDGPDPEWTPKILDVLKKEHAPATFFLIGIQADKFSRHHLAHLSRRPRDRQSHLHPSRHQQHLAGIHAELELNLTERLFASRLGIRTILFRPPYSIDQEPDTDDQVRPLELTQDMGYITVGDKIDPNDWRDNPHRTAEQISSDVLAHLPPCAPNDQRCGNIILLHDGGGDRSQTVRALPMIIEGIRARGYQVVPVYQLLAKNQADVMPPMPQNERWAARLNWVGFWLFDVSIKGITLDFLHRRRADDRPACCSSAPSRSTIACATHRYGTPAQEQAYQPASRGADSCLQRREGHRAHHPLGARFNLSAICASS